ncbi:hypothetical protein MTR_0137s0060 [Medicago truncatula]|uniref:Uncharacterized protein n=1 Tax=Medicago truncatula TaxID=3880 RepID=A0A072TSQ7_MEDTR|nr:hypothetical protein MTR_0137s0060 [Medicago truncatula]
MAGDLNEGVLPNKRRTALEEFVDRPKKRGVCERKHSFSILISSAGHPVSSEMLLSSDSAIKLWKVFN